MGSGDMVQDTNELNIANDILSAKTNLYNGLTIFHSHRLKFSLYNKQLVYKTQLLMSSESNEHKRLGHKFIIAMWIAVMIMVFFLFDDLLENDYNPNQQVNTEITKQQRIVVLKRNRYGHYVTQGKINNHSVTFLLDTGASDISIPDKIAKKLKLKYGQERRYQTANGIIVGNLTQLNQVSIGNIQLRNLCSSINPKMNNDEILLGMSFLKNIEFTQRGDTLILRQ